MSANGDQGRVIAAWLEAEAPDRAPMRLIEASRERVGATSQRPTWWPGWRRPTRLAFAGLGVAAMAVVAIGFAGLSVLNPPNVAPANDDLGIFGPVAGRIVNGDATGFLAFDPNDPLEATAVRFGPEQDGRPLGWSSDGTRLLLWRLDPSSSVIEYLGHLSVLHADGSETLLNRDAMEIFGATIAPDGSRVVFSAKADADADPGLYVVDAGGGEPVRISDVGESPTFSPDGSQIAYIVASPSPTQVWVADADGTNAHEILIGEPGLTEGVFDLAWSPAGDRIAIGNSLEGNVAISTVAPDGSGFTEVIPGGMSPSWSPDGTRIAYTVPYGEPPAGHTSGLGIANADGTDAREFGVAMAGPWHPGALDESTEVPASPSPAPSATPGPTTEAPTSDLGIFAPVSGRIAVQGDDGDLWAVDPTAPSGSTSVRFGPVQDSVPIGWSSDGTRLLIQRVDPARPGPYADQLFILHADGSETPVTDETLRIRGATISPDGARVVFAGGAETTDGCCAGWALYAVDADGGPEEALVESRNGIIEDPAFSPDGAQIVYDDGVGDNGHSIWMIDADGADAHEIVPAEQFDCACHVYGLAWSPTDDRIALGLEGVTYTFAPDGSDVTEVITSGDLPYWSPDGSQIAYTISCLEDTGGCGIGIADADGSDAQEVRFAQSGPWHPGTFVPDDPEPTPGPSATSEGNGVPVEGDGEVLQFTGRSTGGRGDLVAVDLRTGGTRVLVRDLADVRGAWWSADRRWVLYQNRSDTWVVGPDGEPRPARPGLVPGSGSWSPSGARLMQLDGGHLTVLDVDSNSTTDLGAVTGDVTSASVWSPDGKRIVYGARGGTITTVDAESGQASVLVQLPGDRLDSVDELDWSPDGEHLAIWNDLVPGQGRLFVVDADGSNVRAVLETEDYGNVTWSPDGDRLAYVDMTGAGTVRVITLGFDGDTPTLVGEVVMGGEWTGRGLPDRVSPVWSPDGSRIVAHNGSEAFAIDADGSGNVEGINELTYQSWKDGAYEFP